MPSEFPRTTPAKPKTPPSGKYPDVDATGANWRARAGSLLRSPERGPARPDIATDAAHRTSNTRVRIGRLPAAGIDHGSATINPRPRHPGHDRTRGCRMKVPRRRPAPNRRPAGIRQRPEPANLLCSFRSRPPSALFFFRLAPYIGGAGSPAMEINDRRNKPFGPGGSTRRLHPSPPLRSGFRRGRTRIDEGVKGEFFLGMVPPLSGYAIVANDNYAPVAQAA